MQSALALARAAVAALARAARLHRQPRCESMWGRWRAQSAQQQAARPLRLQALRGAWTAWGRQGLAWPTRWGGAAQAAQERRRQAQPWGRDVGVGGSWMKTLGVLSLANRRAGIRTGKWADGLVTGDDRGPIASVWKITPAVAATPEILAQARGG